MTYEQAASRLVALARANGGVLTAEQAEQDPALASMDPAVVAAAARALDGSTNIFGTPRTGEGWFPFDELRFTTLSNTAALTRIAKKASQRSPQR
jgi:hypothetical protein